ncbi:MAG: serine aminopeptidase domain-containing protein [Kineosporiaceae bacterium]
MTGIAGPRPQPLTLTTGDGAELAADHYPAGGAAYLVVAGATATQQRHYRRFATWLQERGVDAVTVDYRGIGHSRRAPLTELRQVGFAQWCHDDLGAAVAWAAERGPTWLVGHSLGGHALGRLPDPGLVRAAYAVGVGSGWSGWMPRAEARRVEMFWRVLGPVGTAAFGYAPLSRFGMGEDIPLQAYRDWKRWCALPRYFFDDPQAGGITRRFAEVRMPVAAAVATDDAWAPPASRDAFFSGFTAAEVDPIDLDPAELGTGPVGHMGYFRPAVGAALWPRILAWFEARGLRRT